MALGRMTIGFITVIVGASLVPTLVTVINSATADVNPAQCSGDWFVNGTCNGTISYNASGTLQSANSLLELTILFFALGVMIAGVGTSVSGLVEYGLV